MKLSLKYMLMLQSLSPLFFLTIVRNFSFVPVGELADNQTYWEEFIHLNGVLIFVFLLCFAWVLAAFIAYIFLLPLDGPVRSKGISFLISKKKRMQA